MDKKNVIIAILIILLLFFVGFFFLGEKSTDPAEEWEEEIEEIVEEDEEDSEDEEEKERDLKDIIMNFMGSSYAASPLDEDENIYNEEYFNSTTLVLVAASNYHYPDDPEEGMREIHYYPPGEVSYETRLHFSTYRNKISDYFSDITSRVGEDFVDSKKIILNKEYEDDKRLIDMEWEEEIALDFIDVNDLISVIPNLPEIVGITFIKDGDEEIGLDVRREGLLIEKDRFIHACPNEEKVIEENILDFLEDKDYDAVNFFQINE